MLPKDDKYLQAGRVIGRSKDSNGEKIGLFNANPIMNTQVYDLIFPDGSIKQYGANIIAENTSCYVTLLAKNLMEPPLRRMMASPYQRMAIGLLSIPQKDGILKLSGQMVPPLGSS